MARRNVRIHSSGGRLSLDTWRRTVTGTSYAGKVDEGEPTTYLIGTGVGPQVRVLMNGEGTTTERFTGIASEDSTDTATVEGYAVLYKPYAGIVYKCNVTTVANYDTQTEIDDLLGVRVAFDVASSVFTIDEDQADGATLCCQLDGGDFSNTSNPVAFFTYAAEGTALGAD